MATLNYWDGVAWLPVSTGGNGGGTPGPAGADGISINVSGPQPTAPLNPRKGDQWIDSTTRALDPADVVPSPMPPQTVTVQLLPDPPETIYVKYLN